MNKIEKKYIVVYYPYHAYQREMELHPYITPNQAYNAVRTRVESHSLTVASDLARKLAGLSVFKKAEVVLKEKLNGEFIETRKEIYYDK